MFYNATYFDLCYSWDSVHIYQYVHGTTNGFVQVTNDNGTNGYCGTGLPPIVYTEGLTAGQSADIVIIFHTDYSVGRPGWKVQVETGQCYVNPRYD